MDFVRTNVFFNGISAPEYKAIVEGGQIEYSVEGIVTVETAWSLVEKEFENTIG